MSFEQLRLALRRGVDRRSSLDGEKEATHRAQRASVIAFLVFGAISLDRPVVMLLFWSEAAGQALLAYEGARELASGGRAVVYFAPTLLGHATALSFVITSTARAALTLSALGPHSLTAFVLVLLPMLAHLFAAAFVRRDRDAWIGSALCASSLVLGIALVARGEWTLAMPPLSYAALLVVGVAALRPSVAERLNLVVFGSSVILGGL